ncbi:Chaperone protein dnaJ 15 [Camellia lanceoleosa]|uniref:Chaperone protein dnaJ 15 n=1 Tax=Camellia lanceoleosa TaxID=1840588 RepID=A0ACC0J5L9_9ERIC|nr:Chaperone protein dnaJ 15 [Camellia lanceoleosa]
MIDRFQNAALESRLGIPLLYGTDAVHGNNNVYGATVFPHNIGLGATRDAELVRRIGVATALEVRACGAQFTFAPCVAALDTDGMDMEIDLSNLGTVNTMFAALFSKLGVPIKTTISANVLEEALSGTVTVRPLPIGTSVSGKVEKQCAHFFGVTISD